MAELLFGLQKFSLAEEWERGAEAVPRTREQLHALAAGPAVELEAMVSVALFCREAWGR